MRANYLFIACEAVSGQGDCSVKALRGSEAQRPESLRAPVGKTGRSLASKLAGDADAHAVVPIFVDRNVGTAGFVGIADIRSEPAVLQRTVQDPRAQPDFPVGPFLGEQRVAGGMPPEFD